MWVRPGAYSRLYSRDRPRDNADVRPGLARVELITAEAVADGTPFSLSPVQRCHCVLLADKDLVAADPQVGPGLFVANLFGVL